MISTENSFLFLLGGLLVTLLVAPVSIEHFPNLTDLVLTVTLLIAVLSLAGSRRIYMFAWMLVILKVLLDIVGFFNPSPVVQVAGALLSFVFFILATAYAFKRVLEGEYVNMNRIAGAISVYMLIGLIWAFLYFFVSVVDPQAFIGLQIAGPEAAKVMEATYIDLMYYSYVTLSTLGYGDITPVSRVARSLAYLEAICDVMYVAVLVAALVGSYGQRRVAQA